MNDIYDEAYEMACDKFQVDDPTDGQIQECVDDIISHAENQSEQAYDAWMEEQL